MGTVGDAYDNALCESFFATRVATSVLTGVERMLVGMNGMAVWGE
jgi:hypothetical protein